MYNNDKINLQVSDDEEEEEELYDYVEEYDEEETKKKQLKNAQQGNDSKKQQTAQANTRKHLSKDKTSSHGDKEENIDPKSDIRNAFFKASANAKLKPDTKSAASANDDDDLANEIMLELQKKKNSKQTVATKPKPLPPAKPAYSQIPFALNTNISKSPAHKRKLSPSANHNNPENKLELSESSRCNKKIDLDDDLVQQLFDSDSQPTFEMSGEIGGTTASANKSSRLNDVSNNNLIKSEPVEYDSTTVASVTVKTFTAPNIAIKKEDEDELEALENIELLSQLSLVEAKQLNNSAFKQEANDTCTSSDLDMDFQLHIKNQSNSNKFLFYWLDAYEDQYNSNGTVYLFGKMPILKQKKEATSSNDKTDASAVSFVSVCCIVKNIPKIVYVLPRKYKKSKVDVVKVEPGEEERELVTMEKVCKEIESLMEKNKIHAYKTKVVKKNFAFDMRGKFIYFILKNFLEYVFTVGYSFLYINTIFYPYTILLY